MAYQEIDLGTSAGDGTGDTIRVGGDKLNDNFVEVYTLLGTGAALTSGISADATVVTLTSPIIAEIAKFAAGGSASGPVITRTNDTNTGIFFSDADELSVTTGGTLRTTVDSTGLAVTGNVTATGTVEPAGDTAAGDNAAIGYTAAEGLILTGQGSTSDITLKNDADATVFTVPTGTDDILFPDGAKAMFGASSDLQIFHESVGNTGQIQELGAGGLHIKSDGALIALQSTGGEEMGNFNIDGSVQLYYDNALKFATSSAGGTLTGTWNVTTALVPDADDGANLGASSLNWSTLFLADGAVINFGDDQDVTLTHVADTGLLLNSTMKLQFNDASQFIHAPSATVLDIAATDEIELTATEVEMNVTTVDINGNVEVSGTLAQVGVATFTARPVFNANITIQNGGQIGSASDADSIAIASNGVVTFSQAPVFPDGSINIADIDLDGGTEIGAAIVDADLFLIDDGAGGTMRKVLASRFKTYIAGEIGSAADNITAGDAAILFTTSAGNITLDAAGNDTDIILKGTDGGADTTFLTIDGSAAGEATFNAGIVIADAGNIGSASDKDAIAIASDGVVTFSQIPVLPDNTVSTADIQADAITGAKIADDAINSEHYTDASIDTAHIGDDQITLAKLAGIARGKIIYGDASGNPDVLAIGSANTVLTSDGTDFAWAAATSNAADDIAAGDAAILLTTSSGDITLDAAANNSDIIFKGTDGGADTTFLTIDGSAAGEATFNAGIVIPNAGNIGSASDKDAIAIASNGVVTFSQIPVLPANSVDSDYYVDGSIDTAHIADSQITSAKIANGTIVAADLASDAVTNAKIADNSIDSEHYVDDSIDAAHLAAGSVDATAIGNDVVNSQHLCSRKYCSH